MVTTLPPEAALARPDPSPFGWLRRPERLTARRRRRHLLVLGLVLGLGLARGVYWSVATPVWSPIDETAHFGYVQAIAEGHGVPVIGKDLVDDDVIVAAKNSPTGVNRAEPFLPTNADANWGPLRQQYEATAGPTYYALMALPYWIGRPFGISGEILAVRLATAILALAAVPITWALARRLFPRHPPVWLVAAGLLVVTNTVAFGTVTNDSLAFVLGGAAVLALLRGLDDRPAPGWVLLAGALLGTALVTKATTLTIAPLLLAVAVTWWLAVRPRAWRAVRVGAVYAAGALAVISPWLVWNIVEYHALSGEKALDRAFGFTPRTLTLGRISTDLGHARLGLWSSQILQGGRYDAFWLLLLVGGGALAVSVAWVRRSWDDVFAVALCVAALPMAFVMSELVNSGLQHRTFDPVGRHLLPVVPFLAIGVAGALGVIVSRRWLPVAAGVVVTLALLLESQATTDLFHRSYEAAVHDDALSPVVEQSWSDHLVIVPGVAVTPSCPVAAFSLGFSEPAPSRLTVRAGDRAWSVPATPVSSDRPLFAAPRPDSAWYRLPVPLDHPFAVELHGDTAINASTTDRSPELALIGAEGDPVATLYCRHPGARDLAFTTSYPINHPVRPGRGFLLGLPWAGAALAGLATATGAVATLRRGRRHLA